MSPRRTAWTLLGLPLLLVACPGPTPSPTPSTKPTGESTTRPNVVPASPVGTRGPIQVPLVSPGPGEGGNSQSPSPLPSGASPVPSQGPSPSPQPTPTPTPPFRLQSVAGDGQAASQDATATPGRLFEPSALLVEAQRVLVAEAAGHRVAAHAFGPPSALSGFAGSGLLGQADGLNLQASFNRPTGLAAGQPGEYFVSDGAAGMLRRILVDGAGDRTVSRLAGGGVPGKADGVAAEARFSGPQGLAYRDGVLYVADAGNHCIRAVELRNGPPLVRTLVGGLAGFADGGPSQASFREPAALAWSPKGELLVADAGNHAIRAIGLASGQATGVTTLIGNGQRGGGEGPATEARLANPSGLAVDPGGALYVADTGNHRIVRWAPGEAVKLLLGADGEQGIADGEATAARLNAPGALAWGADGRLWLVDTGNHRLRVARP